jgi:hypothetical protein
VSCFAHEAVFHTGVARNSKKTDFSLLPLLYRAGIIPSMPSRVPSGIATARAVILIAVLGAAVWYLLWKLAGHLWVKH